MIRPRMKTRRALAGRAAAGVATAHPFEHPRAASVADRALRARSALSAR